MLYLDLLSWWWREYLMKAPNGGPEVYIYCVHLATYVIAFTTQNKRNDQQMFCWTDMHGVVKVNSLCTHDPHTQPRVSLRVVIRSLLRWADPEQLRQHQSESKTLCMTQCHPVKAHFEQFECSSCNSCCNIM